MVTTTEMVATVGALTTGYLGQHTSLGTVLSFEALTGSL